MTAPGGGFGESAHNDEANQPPVDDRTLQQPAWEAPWDAPASSPTADYRPPAYPLPGYPADYPPEYPAGYPEQYLPPMPPPAGYQQPPGYGGPPYPLPPPQFGGPPPGYGPPSYPGGYYPAPDYLGSYGPSQPGMNGLAIGSLVASLTGFLCCVGGIVGIVLGLVALDQIKRTRQDGYALAVAGIVIGIASLIVSLIIGIFALHWR